MIGKRLKHLLTKNNMTQAELSRRLNISQGNISNFINNKRNPSVEILSEIAEFFSVSMDSFVPERVFSSCPVYKLSDISEDSLRHHKRQWVKVDTCLFSPAFKPETLIFIDSDAKVSHSDCIVLFKDG